MLKARIQELKDQDYHMEYQALVITHQQRQEEIQQNHLMQYRDHNEKYDKEFQNQEDADQNEI